MEKAVKPEDPHSKAEPRLKESQNKREKSPRAPEAPGNREVSLQQSRDHYLALFTEAPVSFLMLDKTGVIHEANNAFCELLGLEHSDVISARFHDFIYQRDRKIFHARYKAFYKAPKNQKLELRLAGKNQEPVDVELSATRPRSFSATDKGNTGFLLLNITDIRALKKTEETLSRQHQHLTHITETSPVGIVQVDAEGRIQFANPKAEEVLRLDKSEITNRKYNDHKWRITDFQGNPFPVEKLPFHLVKNSLKPVTNRQHAIKHPDGSMTYLSINASPLLDPHKKFNGMVATIEDITRDLRTQQELRRKISEEKQLFDISIPLCLIDKTFRIIRVNKAYCQAFQVEKEEVIGKECHEIRQGSNCHSDHCMLRSILDGKKADSYENHVKLPDKQEKDFLVRSLPYRDESGEIMGIVETFTDISREKQYLQELRKKNEELNGFLKTIRESEETYRNLFQNAQVGLFRTRISDGKILESNEQLARMFGYDRREEFVSEYRTTGNYVDAGIRKKMLREITENGHIRNFEARFYRKDKSIFWARYSASIYPDKGWIEGVAEDITERKHVESQLLWSERKFKSFFDFSNVGKSITRLTGEVEVNKAFCDMLGYSPAELVEKKWQDISHPDEIDSTEKKIARLLNGEKDSSRFEKRYLHKNGSFVWVDASVAILRDAEGKPLHFLTTVIDITRRKKTEQALLESEKKFQILIDQAPAALFLHAMDGSIIEYNKIALERYGYSDEEIIKLKSGDIDPDYVERENKGLFWEELNQKKQIQFEARHKKKDGTLFPVEVNLAPIEINNEKYYLALAADITERKRSEQEMRESEEKYRSLVNNTLQGVVIAKPDPIRIIFANPAMATISGFSPERLIGMGPDDLLELIHEKDRERFFTNFRKRVQGLNMPYSSEYRVVTREGTVKWVALYSSRIEYEKEPATLTTFMDITKLKQVQAALLESEAGLREAQRLANIGNWRFDIRTGQVSMSDEMYSIIGMTKNDAALKVENHKKYYTSESWRKFMSALKQAGEKGKSYEIEMEIIRPEGINRYAVARGEAVMDQSGKVISLQGTLQDITERKLAEEILKANEIKYRTLVDQASEMLFLHNVDGNVLEVNEAAIQSTGYSRGELEKMKITDIDPDSHERKDMLKYWKRMQPKDPPVTFEGRHQRKDGSIYPAEITISKVSYSGESYILALARDITEPKKAEESLRRMKEDLEIQVKEKTRQLQERISELERFHDATIEREFRIKELRNEIERLQAEKK